MGPDSFLMPALITVVLILLMGKRKIVKKIDYDKKLSEKSELYESRQEEMI